MRSAHAFERLQRLQRLTATLSGAVTVADVVTAVVTAGREELEAPAAMVCLLDEEEGRLTIAGEEGYLPDTAATWASFPLDAPLPACDAIRQREMVVLESVEERDERYPALRGAPTARTSYAIAPLLSGRDVLGALSLGFDDPRRLDAADRVFLRAMADQCGQALSRARLYDGLEATARRQRFLVEAGRVLASSLDLDVTLERVARLATPDVADLCVIYLLEDGGLRLAATAHSSPELEEVVLQVTSRHPYATSPRLLHIVKTGEPLVLSEVPDALLVEAADDEEHLAQLRRIGIGSAIAVSLRARGRPVGVLALARGLGRRAHTVADLEFLEELAGQAGLAIDNARLYAERSEVARTLQAGLAPPHLPVVPGMDIGVAYLAAGRASEVGGDFYDVFRMNDGRWLVVLGDVRGKGVEAAGTAGLARHVIRAVGAAAAAPSEVLQQLNRVLLDADAPRGLEPQFCTACVVVVTPTADAAELVVCRAGHPAPFVVTPGGQVYEVGRQGDLMGVFAEPELADTTVRLRAGEALVTVTDGITDRHDEGRFLGDLLPAILAASGSIPAAVLADKIKAEAESFAEDTRTDDMAVVVCRLPTGR